MNTETFFQQFELLADAPNGIAKLRELILQLAVQGKLVPQNPDDEPAAVLLEKIKAEKERLLKEGKIKKSKILFPSELELKPYELPNSWNWSRLGTICKKLVDGSHNPPKKQYSGIPMLSGQNVLNTQITLEASRYITEEDYQKESARTNIQPGNVLLTIVGTIGRSTIVPENMPRFAIQRSIAVFDSNLYPTYLSLYLRSNIAYDYFLENSKGTAQLGIYLNKLSLLYVAIPPLAEQKRIVEKVNRLMELCDKLEIQQQQQQTKTLQLGTVATSRLTAAKNPEAFKQHWQNISKNFDLIYSTPENIKQLRQTILQLAVMGKLVPQNPDDEPAFVLLAKIKAEKEKLIKEGKIKKSKKLKAMSPDEIPFDLPKTWKWIRLSEIISFMDAGWSPACEKHPTNDEMTWGVLKTTAVQELKYQQSKHKELPEELKPRPEYEVKTGDILITRAGPKNRVGICCLVKDTRPKLMISDKIIRFHLIEKHILADFIALVLNSGFSKSYIESQKSGMAESQMNISQVKLKMTPLSFPPLAEQHRIVAKVNQLMTYCDELEAKLTQSLSDKEKLMDTAVYQLLTA